MKRGLFFVLVLILLISYVSADFELGNVSNSIQTSYGPSSAIKGWINISFDSQSVDSILESSTGEEILLYELLNKNSNLGFSYECNPQSCNSHYSSFAESSSKTFNLKEGESILFGFRIPPVDEFVTDLSDFSFHLISDNPETEKLPLAIDILNDDAYEWTSYVASESFGTEDSGCFRSSESNRVNLVTTPYCERIHLNPNSGAELGAYISADTQLGGVVEFTMSIQKADLSDTKKTCSAISTNSLETQRISCIPSNFLVKEPENYFVCIKVKDSINNNKYKIETEDKTPCGFSGDFVDKYTKDFEIFVKPKKYAEGTDIVLNSAELLRSGSYVHDIDAYVMDYVAENYDENCSKGCVIPVRILAGVNQTISISQPTLNYFAGVALSNNNIYNVSESPATISSGFQRLLLDQSGFLTPEDYGSYTLHISLDGEDVISKQINIKEVPIVNSITPSRTAVKYPTTFYADIDSESELVNYEWDFGDGETQTSEDGIITHTYELGGSYIIKLTVEDESGNIVYKDFNIDVGPASEIVPILFEDSSSNLNSIKSQMNNFSEFEWRSIESLLDLDNVEDKLTVLESSIANAVSESDYELILSELLEINLPLTVMKTASSGEITFYPLREIINPFVLKEIDPSNYREGKYDSYIDGILSWDELNSDIYIIFNEISFVYPEYESSALKIFSVKASSSEESYLVVEDMDNLLFKTDYSLNEGDGYSYVLLDEPKEITFSTSEDINFVDLPVFIAPEISKLTLAEWTPFEKEGGLKRWILFTIIIILILLIAITAWIILQIWYTRKYESYLFKDRNYLYNLISYIERERGKNVEDKEIVANLKRQGWNSEQLSYAMKKYKGKNTGMPVIMPINKILSLFSKEPFKQKTSPAKN